jgi:hypothetical protein
MYNCIMLNYAIYYTKGSQKVPGMAVLHCNRRSYGNAYLITFKAGPLSRHTPAPSILSLLEAPADDFFWNHPEFGHRIRFDVLHGCETCPPEAHFQNRKTFRIENGQKSLGARSGEYGSLMTGMFFSARNWCTTCEVWLAALSQCKQTIGLTTCRATSSESQRTSSAKVARRNDR